MRLISRHESALSEGVSPRIDRVVVGVDFSEASLAAAAWAGRQLAPEAELVLVFVAPSSESRFALRDEDWEGDSSESMTEPSLRGALHGLATLLGSARVAIELRVGDPATELARVAEAHQANLIVVGGRPRHDAPVVGELLRRTDRPVLVARDVPEGAPRTVLAALANDTAAPAILQAAWLVARPCSATVAALHVVDDEERRLARVTWRKRSVQGAARRSLAAELRSGTEAWLERWLSSVDIPHAQSRAMIGDGDPVKEIASAARRTRAAVVVIGAPNEASRLTSPERWAAGEGADVGGADGAGAESALRGTLRAVPCSVLIVPHAVSAPLQPPRRRTASEPTRRRRGPFRTSRHELDAGFDPELVPPPAARSGPEHAA